MNKAVFLSVMLFVLLGLGAGVSATDSAVSFTHTPSGKKSVGDKVTITWTKGGDTFVVNLAYSKNEGKSWTGFAWGLTDLSHEWTIPSGAVGSAVILRARDADPNHPLVEDISDPFEVGE